MKTFSFTIHKRKGKEKKLCYQSRMKVATGWDQNERKWASGRELRPSSAIKNIPLKLFTRYNRKRKFHFFNWLLFIPFLLPLLLRWQDIDESHLNNIIPANSNGDSPRRLWKKYKMKVLLLLSRSMHWVRNFLINI